MKHIVCLTFDFDAISPWIFRDMATPTPISRGEFGIVGAQRVLALLKKHAIQATWFTPGHTLDTYPNICREIHAQGHEIAHHGYLHEPPGALNRQQEEAALLRGIEAIRRVTKLSPLGYRSPAWDLSPYTIELLLAQGFVYDSSMMAHDCQPYHARHGDVFPDNGPAQFGPQTPLIEIPVSWSLDDYPHFEFVRSQNGLLQGLSNASAVLENWLEDCRYMVETEDWGVLTYTFHPQVIGRGHRMRMLERLIVGMKEMGVVFARVDSVAQEWEQQNPFMPAIE